MNGRCYRAASPLLGADDQKGEPWTLLGNKLVQSGFYRTVILIPAAVGGSSVRRWAKGGDLNAMLVAVIGKSRHATPSPRCSWTRGRQISPCARQKTGVGRISNP